MKCRKKLVLTGYLVQYVDLREPKPRTPMELIHVVDSAWLDAVGLLGQSPISNITDLYERTGYKVFSVAQVKPKRVIEVDLHRLWSQAVATSNREGSDHIAEQEDN